MMRCCGVRWISLYSTSPCSEPAIKIVRGQKDADMAVEHVRKSFDSVECSHIRVRTDTVKSFGESRMLWKVIVRIVVSLPLRI